MYWLTSSLFSLVQMLVLRAGPVKKFLGIPDKVLHKEATSEPGAFASFLGMGQSTKAPELNVLEPPVTFAQKPKKPVVGQKLS